MPTLGVNIPVYQSIKSPGSAKIQQHFFVLQPSPDGNMQVTEGFVYQNDGRTTWNDPDRGTLQFELPAAAQGKVEVNVRAPGGLPIRRAPDPLGKPNQFKLDFPIKPGESSVELTWAMPFQSPGVFEDHILSKADVIRVVAPTGVEFKGDDLSLLGQEPTSKANIYGLKGPDVKIQVAGTGLFNTGEDQGGGSRRQPEPQREPAETLRPDYGELVVRAIRRGREMDIGHRSRHACARLYFALSQGKSDPGNESIHECAQ